MRILFIVDGRSPTARNWITHFLTPENQVHLISTSKCSGIPGLASLQVLPVAFSGTGAPPTAGQPGKTGAMAALRQAAPMGLRTFIRQWLGPLTVPATTRRLQAMISEIEPDLIRLSIGLESASDLEADLRSALSAAMPRSRPGTVAVA